MSPRSTDDAAPGRETARTGFGRPGGSAERPAIFFADADEWASWLEANHASAADIWMGLRKKHVPDRGLIWEDAVVEALRFGWIDSQVQRIDEDSVRQRWTPRRAGSTWSAVNVATVGRLIEQGRMTPAGLAAFEARRADREAIYSYEQPAAGLTPEHETILRADPVAAAFWDAATPGYRRIAGHWVGSAKQQATRDRRLAQLVADCAAGRLIPSQRYGTQPAWVGRARLAAGLTAE